jgi:hypothetical protein
LRGFRSAKLKIKSAQHLEFQGEKNSQAITCYGVRHLIGLNGQSSVTIHERSEQVNSNYVYIAGRYMVMEVHGSCEEAGYCWNHASNGGRCHINDVVVLNSRRNRKIVAASMPSRRLSRRHACGRMFGLPAIGLIEGPIRVERGSDSCSQCLAAVQAWAGVSTPQ